ncbi:class III poly(R)-hydroxyalkanoic acid synthase subunit PhaC [Neptuniibacter sp. 1_MG-2023]|uniref:class III poly(R)-hydroxyalkanoic acid synthase subunit PhaC n=1 Tax=Neptuniibacter sp. 1_MG-2023 TaxID=3062662 RepID=UPI0026E135F4|nr:class III poly(R)-hydroxyalkanoic acid synthase subunit PhaC [Neptuniibacter sp. 1_MG-2023]MDO6592381.1 class III poly(R)-hydroxyalkanoic acid synthase subunit PhaC [Neptuniibacter sp. 1_MG-2023]
MNGFDLDIATVSQELFEFNRKLLKSYNTLAQLKEVDVDSTPYDVIYKEDKLKLRYYQATSEKRCKTPLLICYALVNRPYMIDLEAKRSMLQRLLELGLDIYLIDWGYPDAADRYLDLDDYINEYINNCVDSVLQHAGTEQTNLLGICQGGTFSLCYTALNPDKIKNLIPMVTPVDFQTDDNLLYHLAKYVDADLAVETYGNIPGSMLNDSYNSLMPMRLGVQKNLGMPNQLEDKERALSFLRMEKWIYDSPDQAGEAFRQFITQFFQQNKLIKAEAMIGDKRVDLTNITHPILNIFGSFDHLVPPKASKVLNKYVSSSDYQAMEVKAGHIGVFVSGKSQTQVAPNIVDWLIARD